MTMPADKAIRLWQPVPMPCAGFNVIPNMKENPVMNIVQEMRVLCNAALPAGSPVIVS